MKKFLLSNFNIWMAALTTGLMLVAGASISYIPKFAQYIISVSFGVYTYLVLMYLHFKNISDLKELREKYEKEAGENSTSGYRYPVFHYRTVIVIASVPVGIVYFIGCNKLEAPMDYYSQLVLIALVIVLVILVKSILTDRLFNIKKRLTIFQKKEEERLYKLLSDKIHAADENLEKKYKYRAKIREIQKRIDDNQEREYFARAFCNGNEYVYEYLYNINKWCKYFRQYYVPAPRYDFSSFDDLSNYKCGELIKLLYRIRKENGGADPADKELLKTLLFFGVTVSDLKKKEVSDKIKRSYGKYRRWSEEEGISNKERMTRAACFNAFLTYYRIAFKYFNDTTEEKKYKNFRYSGEQPRLKTAKQTADNTSQLDKLLAPLYENCPAFDMKPYASLTISEKQRFYDVIQKNDKDTLIANIGQKKALNYFLTDRITASTQEAKAYYKKLIRQMSKKYHPDVLENKHDLSPAMKAELSREYAIFNQMAQCVMTI